MSLIPKVNGFVVSSLKDTWVALFTVLALLGLPVSEKPGEPGGGLNGSIWEFKISLCVFGIGFFLY